MSCGVGEGRQVVVPMKLSSSQSWALSRAPWPSTEAQHFCPAAEE